MQWRWLIFDYVDPRLKLSRDKRRGIGRRAREIARQGRSRLRGWVVSIALAIALWGLVLLVLMVIQPWDARSRIWSVAAPLSVWLVFYSAPVIYGAWQIRPRIYQAMRESGIAVCPRCGYPSQGSQSVCSECGAALSGASS